MNLYCKMLVWFRTSRKTYRLFPYLVLSFLLCF